MVRSGQTLLNGRPVPIHVVYLDTKDEREHVQDTKFQAPLMLKMGVVALQWKNDLVTDTFRAQVCKFIN